MALKSKERNMLLDKVYGWCNSQGFKGYNKHDGLNSPILGFFCNWHKWARIIAIQAVMRFPLNVRPLLFVPKTVNPKGLALFILGLLDRHKNDPDNNHLKNAIKLSDLLLNIRSQGTWSGACWGYPYPWQDLGFFAPPNTPNAVVTSFVCEAFLELYKSTDDDNYLTAVGSAIDFFLNDLTVLKSTSEMMCLAYMPLQMSMRVMDVSILVGAVIAEYAHLTNDAEKMVIAKKLVNYVVDKQTEYFAWYYTDPPEDSLIQHDNYHTGFILDALWRYMTASGDWQWKNRYESGLEFYSQHLFKPDGSPCWMSDKDFPNDIHGSAQGLITFSLAVKNGYNYQDLLENILSWAVKNMYNGKGRFYYQKRLLYTKKFTLLRWCNAWMFRGISSMPTT